MKKWTRPIDKDGKSIRQMWVNGVTEPDLLDRLTWWNDYCAILPHVTGQTPFWF